jgi:hypothetical protein
MPKVVFEGETHQEIVQQVKRWLASQEADAEGLLTPAQAVAQGAGLTKDALRLIASAAPKPIAQNDLVKGLTELGYKATDTTKEAVLDGLTTVETLSGGSVLRKVSQTAGGVVYEMNAGVAKGILRSLTRR